MNPDTKHSGYSDKEHPITIRIQSFFDIKRALRARETEFSVPAKTNVRQLLRLMTDHWGEELANLVYQPGTQEPARHVQLQINNRSISFLEGLDTELNDNDRFLIIPPVGGG